MNNNSLYWPSVGEVLEAVKAIVRYNEHTFILLYEYGISPMTTAVTKPDSPSAAVERALAMLEAVAQESEGLSNAEISRKLNIPKSSASYILRTLETRGYLGRDAESGKYRV